MFLAACLCAYDRDSDSFHVKSAENAGFQFFADAYDSLVKAG